MGLSRRSTLAIVVPLAVAGAVLVAIFGLRATHDHGAATSSRPSPAAQRAPRSRSLTRHPATTTTTAVQPGAPYAVGVTQVSLSRTDATGFRPLPVSVWYPALGSPGGAETSDAPAASGSFSLVLFAHGWNGSADFYADMDREIAAAGFIVAAPSF